MGTNQPGKPGKAPTPEGEVAEYRSSSVAPDSHPNFPSLVRGIHKGPVGHTQISHVQLVAGALQVQAVRRACEQCDNDLSVHVCWQAMENSRRRSKHSKIISWSARRRNSEKKKKPYETCAQAGKRRADGASTSELSWLHAGFD